MILLLLSSPSSKSKAAASVHGLDFPEGYNPCLTHSCLQIEGRARSMPLPYSQPERPRNQALADPISSMPLPESSSMPSLHESNRMHSQCEDPFPSDFGLSFEFPSDMFDAGICSQQSDSAGDTGRSFFLRKT